jgi:transposase
MQELLATHVRIIQDLPIFCKHVSLRITGYDFRCDNEVCERKAFADDYAEFVGRYERMTSRLGNFILVLAMETSCEGAANICHAMGIKISGDTIIRMLRKLNTAPASLCSDTIGVDDFAYRKGRNYCTVICDGETHRVIDIIEGRDGEGLREWLKQNRHVKRVTRDRASAYARAVSDILPDAMQVADRFHLHQNLLNAIKEALKRELPDKVAVPLPLEEEAHSEDVASVPAVDKKTKEGLTVAEQRRYETIVTIQNLLDEGYAPTRIKEMLNTTYNRIRRYATGDPLLLCRFSGDKPKEVEMFRDEIIAMLQQNLQKKQILEALIGMGFRGKRTAVGDYCRSLIAELGMSHTPRRNTTGAMITVQKPKIRSVSRRDLMTHIWTGSEMDKSDVGFIKSRYPRVIEIIQCVQDFRRLYAKTEPFLLSQFIDKYGASTCSPLKSFASGLSMDLAAVQNSITSELSNGFVEGLNTKIKAIKRLGYGRAKVDLLRARVVHAR